MKTAFLVLAAATLAAAPAARPAATAPQNPPDPAKDAEKLPEYPKLDPKNTLKELNPAKTIFGEFAGPEGKKKVVRVGLVAEVCLREGPLEVFLCKKGTKEHEAIVRIDADARTIHQALEVAGAKKGTPTQFVKPGTDEAQWKPATGTKINITVHYTKDGKPRTHAAQEWIWDRKKKTAIPHGWVFSGSIDIENPNGGPPFYGANSGDIFSISNFPYSLLEMPVEISKDDANLTYEAKTDKIPPLYSKVWVILEPVPDKK